MHTREADLRDGRRRRRRHSAAFKAQVVAECEGPGVSIAAIALHHGLNANLLRRWVAQAGAVGEESRQQPTHTALEAFVPVTIAARDDGAERTIEIEIKRAAMSVRIRWPMSASIPVN